MKRVTVFSALITVFCWMPAALAAPVAGDVNSSGAVDAIDVQLVINGALGINKAGGSDIDYSEGINAVDIQLVINAALGIVIDSDVDGLCDVAEANLGTDPALADSDRDGVGDGQELLDGTDPRVSSTGTITETILLPGEVPLEMVWIAAGTFMMGCNPGEENGGPEEEPQHEVRLIHGFWIGKYELTKRQWQAMMGTTPWSGQYGVIDDLDSPAVYVSWDDAHSFVATLNSYTGQTFRLPSEAQWEYACRAGTTTRCYWGDDPSYTAGNDYAWTPWNTTDVNEPYAHVVGQKLANAWGLYDMSGNVSEWCQDWYHSSYMGAPANGSAWEAPTGSGRVTRGGHWDSYYYGSVGRGGTDPVIARSATGFRPAKFEDGVSFGPTVTSFSINNGAPETASPLVTLDYACPDRPTHYMASESSSFSGASWKTYAAGASFTITSAGTGTKTVYFKVMNAVGESGVASDMIVMVDTVAGATEETILLPGNVPLEMAWIPAGTFMMGRYPDEQYSEPEEDPQHQVTLLNGFWMGKYELTKRQWQAVMGTTPWLGGLPYVLDDLDSPAQYVSWNDAQAFIVTLNTYTGLTFRLPAEAEWEYACRAGTTTPYYWGNDMSAINDYAWNHNNAHSYNASEMYAHVVGQKLPNAWGFYDMSGNVRELCQDWWHDNYMGAPVDGSAWESPTSSGRVVRGGALDLYSNFCRSAFRSGGVDPDYTRYHTGFRLVRSE